MRARQANFDSIPVLDMSQPDSAAFRQQLADVCHHVGFFYLGGHPVSTALLHDVIHLTREFYALPQHKKDSINISFSPHYRGYGKLNAEITLGVPDFKETLDLGLERAACPDSKNHPYMVLHGPNQWPDLERFKDVMLQYMQAMQQTGYQLMQELTKAIGLPDTQLAEKFNPDSSDAFAMLRLLHYPPATSGQLGVGPHTDPGCLVFLLQDDCGGLQVKNHAGEWIDAPPRPDMLIVNIGEMLQLLSGNYFLATPHRVINQSGRNRYSAPFFFEPNLSASISAPGSTDSAIYGEQMLAVARRSFPN